MAPFGAGVGHYQVGEGVVPAKGSQLPDVGVEGTAASYLVACGSFIEGQHASLRVEGVEAGLEFTGVLLMLQWAAALRPLVDGTSDERAGGGVPLAEHVRGVTAEHVVAQRSPVFAVAEEVASIGQEQRKEQR